MKANNTPPNYKQLKKAAFILAQITVMAPNCARSYCILYSTKVKTNGDA